MFRPGRVGGRVGDVVVEKVRKRNVAGSQVVIRFEQRQVFAHRPAVFHADEEGPFASFGNPVRIVGRGSQFGLAGVLFGNAVDQVKKFGDFLPGLGLSFRGAYHL